MPRKLEPGVEVLHIKVFRAGIGRMGFHAVLGEEEVDHDDGGEHDGSYCDSPREAVDTLMARVENEIMLRAWSAKELPLRDEKPSRAAARRRRR